MSTTSFRGQLIRPGEGSYEEHRKIWNGSIDRRPALIARCAGVADVIAALGLAKRAGLQVAGRAQNHRVGQSPRAKLLCTTQNALVLAFR